MLNWDINFIKIVDGQQVPVFRQVYENGIQSGESSQDAMEKSIFINYISAFPSKDIVRMKLGLEGHYLYSYYYIDKTHLKEGFLGIMGVSEYQTTPYIWPETEIVLRFISREFFKRIEDGRISETIGQADFLGWLNPNIQEYFQGFKIDKEKYNEICSESAKETILLAFQNVAHANVEKSKKSSKKLKKSFSLIPELKHDLDKNIECDDEDEEQDLDRINEFALINSFGQPLTKIVPFVNGKQRIWGSEEEQNTQSLEGMTYSVLKSFVDQQNLNLQEMVVRKPDKTGFEFILFKTFQIKGHNYLLIMNVENINRNSNRSLGKLLGYEEKLLNKVANTMMQNPTWFTESGDLSHELTAGSIEFMVYRKIRAHFAHKQTLS